MDPVFALFAAVDRGDLQGASELLAAAPEAVRGRFHGATALHRAAARGDRAMLDLLLERGAAIDLPDEAGATALAWATDADQDAAFDLLLERGAEPSLIDLAARGLTDLLERALDEAPWQIDQETAQGGALHAAVRRCRPAALQLLLARGADPRLRDGEGRTPADLARQSAQPQLQAWIEAALARGEGALGAPAGEHASAADSVRYRCGACAEEIVIDIDRTEGEQQRFVEDCPVCCRANVIDVHFESGNFKRVSAELE